MKGELYGDGLGFSMGNPRLQQKALRCNHWITTDVHVSKSEY